MSTTRIIDFFDGLTDFRHPYRNKRHELIDIVAISICAVICVADSWEEIEAYAKNKKDWLTKFLRFQSMEKLFVVLRLMASLLYIW